MVPDDGLQLEEALEGVLVERELLVAEPLQRVTDNMVRFVLTGSPVFELTIHFCLIQGCPKQDNWF